MAKHSVPKKKTSKAKSKRRYSTFESRAQKALLNKVHLTKCPSCSSTKLMHHVCKECGQYKKRQVIDLNKKIEKITKVKA